MERPDYRRSRHERAVRVYTISHESRYLIVKNVPALGCIEELVKLFELYGPIEEYRTLDEEDCEPFTDVYWIKYSKLCNATFAKRKLDDYKFLGNLLEVSYAPQCETLSDTKDKLEERRRIVLNRIRANSGSQHEGQKHPPKKRSVSNLNDPLLPGHQTEATHYPTFPLERLLYNPTGKSQDVAPSVISHSPVQEPEVKECAEVQYFPLSSMNATVQRVRDALSTLESTSGSRTPTVATKDIAASADAVGGEKMVHEETLQKKRRQDNRRRI